MTKPLKKEDYLEENCPLIKDKNCNTSRIDIARIIRKLNLFLDKNDLDNALKLLLFWEGEAKKENDDHALLTIYNELMGFFRKIKNEKALDYAKFALDLVEDENYQNKITKATTFINIATVYKAFNKARDAIFLFLKAKKIYEEKLLKNDARLAGLYNNMALAYVDLLEFDEAKKYYELAIDVMEDKENGKLDQAISYLNLASMYEAKLGLLDANDLIEQNLKIASNLLFDEAIIQNGYAAFVYEKCASVFAYYGWFKDANTLKERSKTIYERN